MVEKKTVARPYAKAAFNYAVDRGLVDQWTAMIGCANEVLSHLKTIGVVLNGQRPEYLANFIIKVCDGQLNKQGQNLVRLMAENRRLEVLPAVYELFLEYGLEYRNQRIISVLSVTELSEMQLRELTAKLEKNLGRKVQLKCSVDCSLVAGMIISAGDMVIDGSAKRQLSRLSDVLEA